jgi:hypothetical protein
MGKRLLINLCSLVFAISLFHGTGFCECSCGSTDYDHPCTGNTISVTVPKTIGANSVSSVFNWAFNSGGVDARCGQMASGDYWIAPSVGENSVTITGITTTSPGGITADADPTTEQRGLLNNYKAYGNYDASQNIIPNLPQTYTSTTSIVAAVQRSESTEGNCGASSIVGECVDAYNVLSILPSVPLLAGSHLIRPNITGTNKEILYLEDFDLSRIPSKSFFPQVNAQEILSATNRWKHSIEIFGLASTSSFTVYSEGGRAFRAENIVDDYGSGVATEWANDFFSVSSDKNSLEEKIPLIAAMLSYGLDIYHAVYDSPIQRYFYSGAGQHAGKYPPVAFLAALSLHDIYARNTKEAEFKKYPEELYKINNDKNILVWGDHYANNPIGDYWYNLFKSQCYDGASGTCTPAIGNKSQRDPYGYVDGPPNLPGTGYMGINYGTQRALLAQMMVFPALCAAVNDEHLLTYIERLNTYGLLTKDDPCVTPDSRESVTDCNPYSNIGCIYYGVTWGPDPNNPVECIKTATPPYNKIGRFLNIDNTPISMVYTSLQAENNWNQIVSESTCFRILPKGSVLLGP